MFISQIALRWNAKVFDTQTISQRVNSFPEICTGILSNANFWKYWENVNLKGKWCCWHCKHILYQLKCIFCKIILNSKLKKKYSRITEIWLTKQISIQELSLLKCYNARLKMSRIFKSWLKNKHY